MATAHPKRRQRAVAVIAVAALLAVTLWDAPRATAQGIDCGDTDWVVTSSAEFDAAVTCWHGATVPGDYSITLTADAGTSLEILAKTADFSLRIDGQDNVVQGALRFGRSDGEANGDDIDAADTSPFHVTQMHISADGAWAAIEADRVSLSTFDISTSGSLYGIIITGSDAELRRILVRGHEREGVFIEPGGYRGSRVVVAQAAILDQLDSPGISVFESYLLLEDSIIRGNNGGVHVQYGGEVAIVRSGLIDNDINILSGPAVNAFSGGSVVSVINSTITGHDGLVRHAFYGGGVTAGELTEIRVANSTLLGNASLDLGGPVEVWSSLANTCDPDGDYVRGEPLYPIGPGDPIDRGGNAGGCFGSTLTWYPPTDFGTCVHETPIGCVPVVHVPEGSASLGNGTCRDTLVIDPAFDIFTLDADVDRPRFEPVMTTLGQQTTDQLGRPRVRCDAGAFESTGVAEPNRLRLSVASWDLANRVCCEYFAAGAADPYTEAIADVVAQLGDDAAPDVVMLQGTFPSDPNRGEGINGFAEDVQEALADRDQTPITLVDWTFDDLMIVVENHVVLSRVPIEAEDAVLLPSADQPLALLKQATVTAGPDREPIRLVSFEVMGFPEDLCPAVAAIEAWLGAQPPQTTIVMGGFAAEVGEPCVAEFASRWIDLCSAVVNGTECVDNMDPIVAPDGRTEDLILYRPDIGSVAAAGDGAVGVDSNAAEWISPHRPIVATVLFDGAGAADLDADGVPDADDACPAVADAQTDIDGDTIGDACDPVLDGDANCTGDRNIVDALVIAQWSASVRVDAGACPLADPTTEIFAYGADANHDGTTNIIDALLIARCAADIATVACPSP